MLLKFDPLLNEGPQYKGLCCCHTGCKALWPRSDLELYNLCLTPNPITSRQL